MQQESFNTLDSQTIFDVALSTGGSLEGVVDLLVLNNLDFDSILPASITYDVQDNYMVRYLSGTDINTGSGTLPVIPPTLPYTNTGNGDKEVIKLSPVTQKAYKVKEEQNIFDVVCMLTGNMENVIDVMVQNNITFSSGFSVGATFRYEGNMFISEDITTGGSYQATKATGAFSDGFHDGFQ